MHARVSFSPVNLGSVTTNLAITSGTPPVTQNLLLTGTPFRPPGAIHDTPSLSRTRYPWRTSSATLTTTVASVRLADLKINDLTISGGGMSAFLVDKTQCFQITLRGGQSWQSAGHIYSAATEIIKRRSLSPQRNYHKASRALPSVERHRGSNPLRHPPKARGNYSLQSLDDPSTAPRASLRHVRDLNLGGPLGLSYLRY